MLQGKSIRLYTVYKITNLINGRYYIGKHICRDIDDNYFGSGKALLCALAKYGKENFVKEFLFFAFDKDGMDWAEKELVVTSYDDPASYNIKPGGEGGSGFGEANSFYGKTHSDETIEKIRAAHMGKRRSPNTEFKPGQIGIRAGSTNTTETKLKISQKLKSLNIRPPTRKGTVWINDGIKSTMISGDSDIPIGFVRGRIYPKNRQN